MSARVVQKYVLNQISDPRLQLYIVWGPMLGGEKEEDAHRATVFLADSRAHHYWTPEHGVAERFEAPLGLKEEPAWDTFLVYSPKAEWKPKAVPPVPSYFMHVGRSLPEDRRFNGETLAEEIRKLLAEGTAEEAASGISSSGTSASGAP
ncbi:MAG: hypothetical protein K0U98_03630 [Deltaproteobacteria bacterium]|nr:hypothetical protein [Deltaproteobacteria bacterium]